MSQEASFAYITAIYGSYETSAKVYIPQSLPSDFICFTDNPNIIANDWIIDTTPYHLTHPSPLDDGTRCNSLANNKHTFNIAKYYKEQWHLIPRLATYDYVIWLDGTMSITHPEVSEHLYKIFSRSPREKVITIEHDWRFGSLEAEVMASVMPVCGRYCVTEWFGQKQPYQDILAQYKIYLAEGYTDYFWKQRSPNREHYGVFVTCFVAWPMGPHSEETKHFLNMWYAHNLQFTTQDQIAFPFICQKLGILPYIFPDETTCGNQSKSFFYLKHGHGI